MNDKIFYQSQELFSYKRLNNLICHLRGKGKTYHFTKKIIERGIAQKKVVAVILVRYKEDIKANKDRWWEIVEHIFPDCHFETTKNTIFVTRNGETFPIAEFVALTEYVRAKKVPRPYVEYIWFDEFLNEENDYLPNEIDAFLSICDSVIRHRENCRVVLTANTITMLNPYFEYFGITRIQGKFTKGIHNSILEFVDTEDVEFINFRKNTMFGSSIDGTGYGQFALEGKFMLDDTTNVIPNPKGSQHYLFNVMLHGINIAVYEVNCLLFFSEDRDDTRKSFTPYLDDAKNKGGIYSKKDFRYFDIIERRVLKDEVMYQTLRIKNEVLELVKWKLNVSTLK